MIELNIKPLSVNQAWKGRRFKTATYSAFESEAMATLPPLRIPAGPLLIIYHFHMSNAKSDIDNPVKTFQDILQKKYKFNDERIFCIVVQKIKCEKGKEKIKFKIMAQPKRLGDILKDIEILNEAAKRDPARSAIFKGMADDYKKKADALREETKSKVKKK